LRAAEGPPGCLVDPGTIRAGRRRHQRGLGAIAPADAVGAGLGPEISTAAGSRRHRPPHRGGASLRLRWDGLMPRQLAARYGRAPRRSPGGWRRGHVAAAAWPSQPGACPRGALPAVPGRGAEHRADRPALRRQPADRPPVGAGRRNSAAAARPAHPSQDRWPWALPGVRLGSLACRTGSAGPRCTTGRPPRREHSRCHWSMLSVTGSSPSSSVAFLITASAHGSTDRVGTRRSSPWCRQLLDDLLQPAGQGHGQPAAFRRGSGPGSAVRSIGTRTRFPHSTQEPS
jgi:hypothetical protein